KGVLGGVVFQLAALSCLRFNAGEADSLPASRPRRAPRMLCRFRAPGWILYSIAPIEVKRSVYTAPPAAPHRYRGPPDVGSLAPPAGAQAEPAPTGEGLSLPGALAGLRERVPLAPFSTLGVGGPARWFLEAASPAAVAAGVDWAGEQGVPLFVLGGGSNLLI